MDPENTSLFLQNLLLMQDNERLWRQAQRLDQENKALLTEIKQRQQQLQQGTVVGPSGSGSCSASGGDRSVSAAGANHKAKAAGGKQPK